MSATSVSTFSMISSASAFLMRTPAVAPRPVPTMMDIGVARPSAHGHAMISTETALMTACARRGSGPQVPQTTKVAIAMTTTAGTNHDETRSATRWIGARLRCASLTMRTIWASKVSLPTRSARMRSEPVPLTVAPMSRSPSCFSTGMDSPVTMDSSTELAPWSTTPSTGTFSPGRTRRTSPGSTCARGMSSSRPSCRTMRAVAGASPSKSWIAALVRLRARSSMTCPSRTSAVITAAASK